MALLPKCPIFVYLENVSSLLPIEFDDRWPWIFWKLFLIGGFLGFGVMWMVLTSWAAPTLPPNILLSLWKPSCGEGMLGNFTESDIADVKLFNPDWNLLRGLWSFCLRWGARCRRGVENVFSSPNPFPSRMGPNSDFRRKEGTKEGRDSWPPNANVGWIYMRNDGGRTEAWYGMERSKTDRPLFSSRAEVPVMTKCNILCKSFGLQVDARCEDQAGFNKLNHWP